MSEFDGIEPVTLRMPQKMFCVLISGKAYSGKSTTVESLTPFLVSVQAATRGETFVFVGNFGDVLKEECAKKTGVDLKLFYSQEGKNTMLPEPFNMTAGRFLQVHGEGERERDPQVWVNHLLDKARLAFSESSGKHLLILVGDCRHPNEIDSLRSTASDGLAVRLEGDPSGLVATTTRDMRHISETALDDYENFDMRFDTNTTLVAEVTYRVWRRLLHDNHMLMGCSMSPLVILGFLANPLPLIEYAKWAQQVEPLGVVADQGD